MTEEGALAETMDTRFAMTEDKRGVGASGALTRSPELTEAGREVSEQLATMPLRMGRFLSEDSSLPPPSQVSRLAAAQHDFLMF